MASQEHISRKELKGPDEFFETVGLVNRYLTEHRREAVIGAAGVVVLFVAVISGIGYVRSQREAAATAFARAMSNLEYDSPSAARAGFSGLVEKSNAGPYGELALLLKAQLASEAGEYAQATTDYDAFLESTSIEYLEQAGVVGKAFAAETSGDAKTALGLYNSAATMDGPYTGQALEAAARVAEKSGDREAAATALQKLLELGGSNVDDDALTQRIEALKAQQGS